MIRCSGSSTRKTSLPPHAPISAIAADALTMPGARLYPASPNRSIPRRGKFLRHPCHESTHWTRHASRLDRDMGRKSWGDEGYAREELVAELGAAFLCADLEITPENREDHASYIASWLGVLKGRQTRDFLGGSARAASRGLPAQPPAQAGGGAVMTKELVTFAVDPARAGAWSVVATPATKPSGKATSRNLTGGGPDRHGPADPQTLRLARRVLGLRRQWAIRRHSDI